MSNLDPAKNAGSNLSRRYRLVLTLILGALSAFAPLSIDMYLAALPEITVELQATASLGQLSLTACLLGISVGQFFAGPISDIYGRKWPLLAGLAAYALASLLCAVAPDIWTFIIFRFVQGFAGSAGIVISRAAVRDLFAGPEMTRFFAQLMLVNGAAPILAPVLGGLVLQIASWRVIFVILAVVGVVMLFTVLGGMRETLPPAKRMKGGVRTTLLVFRELLRNKTFMGYVLSQGFSMAAMFAYIAGSPFVIQEFFGASPQLFSLFFAVNSVGIICASQLTGRLASRIREEKLFAVGLGIGLSAAAILLAVILLAGSLYAVLVPLFFVIASGGIVGTTSFTLAMRDQAKNAGSASALIGIISFIFGGLMAPLAGMGGGHTALPMGLVILAAEIAAALAYFCLVLANKKTEKQCK